MWWTKNCWEKYNNIKYNGSFGRKVHTDERIQLKHALKYVWKHYGFNGQYVILYNVRFIIYPYKPRWNNTGWYEPRYNTVIYRMVWTIWYNVLTWTFVYFRRPSTAVRIFFLCLPFATSSSVPSSLWCPRCRPWCPVANWTGCRWATVWLRRLSLCGSLVRPCWETRRLIRACSGRTGAWAPWIWWWRNVDGRECRVPEPWSELLRTLFLWPPHRPHLGRSIALPKRLWLII